MTPLTVICWVRIVHLAPGGGKPLHTPRHLGDSRQSGSANEQHPGSEGLGARNRAGGGHSLDHLFTHPFLHSFLPDTPLFVSTLLCL